MAAARNINNLTSKQQVFCDLYRASDDDEIRGNAKRCYMIAFGVKEKTAESSGPRLLKDKHVKMYLETKREMAEDKADITEERILREVSYSAFLDPRDFFDEAGVMLPITDMPEHARRALASIEVDSLFAGSGKDKLRIGKTTKIKHIDKKGMLELLMKQLGMLTDNVHHSGSVGGVLAVPADMSAEEWLNKQYPNRTQTSQK